MSRKTPRTAQHQALNSKQVLVATAVCFGVGLAMRLSGFRRKEGVRMFVLHSLSSLRHEMLSLLLDGWFAFQRLVQAISRITRALGS